MNFRDKLSRLTAPVSRPGGEVRRDTAARSQGVRSAAVEAGLQSVACADAGMRFADLQSVGSLEPEFVPEAGEIVRVMEQLAADVSAERDVPAFAVPSLQARSLRTPRDVETDEERAERIANLRSLIGDVLAKGAVWRSPRAATQIGRSAAEFEARSDRENDGLGENGSHQAAGLELQGDLASSATNVEAGRDPTRPGGTHSRSLGWQEPEGARVEPTQVASERDGFEPSASATARARTDARVRAATERARAAWAKARALSDSCESASIAIHEDLSATAPRTRVDLQEGVECALESHSSALENPELIVVRAGDGSTGSERATARAPSFAPPIATASADALRAALDGWIPARIRAPHPQSRLPWATRETSRGPVHVVERWLEPHHQHGNTAVRGAIDRLPATLAALALDPALASLDLSRMLFLDTETTGLAGGSGTVAFLVGLASFEDASLRLEQLLVPNLGGEVPMLVALAERLAAASCMLTYNGKSFDWPLLRTRYVMNRLSVPALPPHVDLLHATRRIWKPRLGSLRLTEIERQIMRFFREDDLDGAEIPARYFSFLQDGGSEWLLPVLEHNQNDLIALPAMLGALGERFELVQCGDHALDALAFGKLALRALDPARAEAFARAAIAASDGDPLAPQAWTFSGEVARRAGEMPAAIRHFEQALQLCEDPERSAALHVVLAKLYEHTLRDFVRAYDHARFTEPAEGAEVHGRRLGRLTRKLEREAARLRARRA